MKARRQGRERPDRARGQSLLEFALVMPIFLALVGALFQFGGWAYDGQALGHAARIGSQAGQAAMEPVNARDAADPRLSTIATAVTDASLPACRQTANAFDPNAAQGSQPVGRLGWDWGCPGMYSVTDSSDPASIISPLVAAIKAARAALPAVFIGAPDKLTITACYATASNTYVAVPVMCATATDLPGGPGAISLGCPAPSSSAPPCSPGPPNPTTTNGPSFLTVSLAALVAPLWGTDDGITLRQSITDVLNRWLPPCGAPLKNLAMPAPGTCGAIF
jgi:hypothetical protein